MSKKKSDIKQAAIGEEVSQKYLQAFYPKPEKNMKWLFSMFLNVQGMNVQAEMTMEITQIKGDEVTIRTTMANQHFENKIKMVDFAPVPTTAGPKNELSGYRFETEEDINIPYGEIKSATKLSTITKDGRTNLWLSDGIGPVKFGISVNGIPASLELKEFSS